MFCRRRSGRLIFFTWSLSEPYGGTKILHTPPSMGAGQGRGDPAYPPAASSFRAFFSPCRSRPGFKDAPSCLPYYGGRGRRKEKAGAVKKAGFGHAGLSGPVQGFCPWRARLPPHADGKGCCGRGLRTAARQRFRSRRTAAGNHRGKRPPGMRKGPRKTGALADVGLSGPQAWDVPVRAASRKGDQPAGRPARRAPGSCRCCDRW